MRRFAIVLGLLAGCQAHLEPAPLLTKQAVTTLASYYAGSVISGPTTAPADNQVYGLIVHVRWVALAAMPTPASTSLGSHAKLIVAGDTSSPLLGSPSLTSDVRVVDPSATQTTARMLAGPPSSTLSPISDQSGALPAGVTAVFKANVGDSASPRQSAELRISRDPKTLPTSRPWGTALNFSLTISRIQSSQTETVLFDHMLGWHGDALILLMPTRFDDPSATVLAACIDIKDGADQTAVAQTEQGVQQSYKALADRSGIQPIGISQSAGIESALRALRVPGQQRSALVYLAHETNAQLAQDIALVADNSILYELSQKFLAASGNVPAEALPMLGWLLDRSSFEVLTSLADSPDGSRLPPELATVLTQFAGEAARHTASLDEIAHGMSSEADLQNRIVAQNLVFLTDSSPAARVRAFDWLSSRHFAPPGYDPLGTGRERRLALDKATTRP